MRRLYFISLPLKGFGWSIVVFQDLDKKIVRREPWRDGKILSDHRQDGNDEVHRL